MERVDHEGQIATAMTLSRMLSVAPLTQQGPVKFVIFDIHALQTRFYFQDSILPCLLSAMPRFLRELEREHVAEKIAIVFPDDGSKKRFSTFFPAHFEKVVCSKMRVGDERLLKVTEGDPSGRHCFVVDDLVQSGGTLINCNVEMRALGAARVSAFVTHGVFPNESWRKFTPPHSNWDIVYITDTIPTIAQTMLSNATA
eukprot:TRINITY_DN8742_c0_g1_i1.p1 TRINITY_DN8742_c0_g1~~TRINITY_DN8742_c0_g1_i1.p1  ORF type:complete len:199 (-),score=51.48 TRINITY_DN8742_c0_g1_i1:247-843(-)